MKRIRETPRVCQAPGCGAVFLRKRYATGQLEDISDFNRRIFCDLKCRSLAKRKKIKGRRECERCGEPLVRKRRGSRRLESVKEFRRRRFCSRECAQLWLMDGNFSQGERHSLITRRSPKWRAYCARRSSHKHRRLVRGCSFCAQLAPLMAKSTGKVSARGNHGGRFRPCPHGRIDSAPCLFCARIEEIDAAMRRLRKQLAKAA